MKKQLVIDEIVSERGKIYIAKIKLSVIREDTANEPVAINTPEDVLGLDFVREELQQSDREKFMCIHLNIKNIVLSYEIVSIGSVNSSIVHPRELYKGALLSNAAAIIIAHNHPSGVLDPSLEDIQITKRLVEAGNILGVQVLDHIIFGDRSFFSLKERGFM